MNTPKKSTRRSAFTLIELLTVIAIIGILAAIIIPTVGKVRQSARAAACLSNLRQVGAAQLLYADENKGFLVPIDDPAHPGGRKFWRYLLTPYLGGTTANPIQEILFCPADISEPARAATVGQSPSSYGIPVATRLHNFSGEPYGTKKLSSVKRPAQTMFAGDIGMVENPGDAPINWRQRANSWSPGYASLPGHGNWSSGDWCAFPRHNGNVNVVFYDGHTKAVHVQRDLVDHASPTDPLCIFSNQ